MSLARYSASNLSMSALRGQTAAGLSVFKVIVLVVFFGRIERFQRNDFGDDGSLKASAAVEFKNFFTAASFCMSLA